MGIEKIIAEYPKDYCRALELAYGEGMMSEGGVKRLSCFFSGIDLSNKKVLEIGFGLGGLANHIAKRHSTMQYTGVEINPQLVEYAKSHYQRDNTCFLRLEDPNILPFEAAQFDVIFSKGVLVHLQNKAPLFKSCFRALKKQGQLLINDWLSVDGVGFGEGVDEMCKLEGLILFSMTLHQYRKLLL